MKKNNADTWMLAGQFLKSLGGVIMGFVLVAILIAVLVALAIPSKPTAQESCIENAQTVSAIDHCMGR